MTAPSALELAGSIGAQFVAWQGASGGLDPRVCPFAVDRGVPDVAVALYRLFERTGEGHYKAAADRYAVFSIVVAVEGAASYQHGGALVCYRELCRRNPDEPWFSARADGLFDWLQRRRVERGYVYDPGYVPPDLVDDLALVGGGLVAYYEQSGRQEALTSALRLSDYFLRAHHAGSPDGGFSESQGTWVGGALGGRGAVAFLTGLRRALPPDHPRAALMRDRCLRSVHWQLTRGDESPGGAAAALLAYDDLRRVGWVDDESAAALGPRAEEAVGWLLEGGAGEPDSRGGSVGELAWVVEALLRWEGAADGR